MAFTALNLSGRTIENIYRLSFTGRRIDKHATTDRVDDFSAGRSFSSRRKCDRFKAGPANRRCTQFAVFQWQREIMETRVERARNLFK